MRVGLTITAIVGDLSGYFFGIFRFSFFFILDCKSCAVARTPRDAAILSYFSQIAGLLPKIATTIPGEIWICSP